MLATTHNFIALIFFACSFAAPRLLSGQTGASEEKGSDTLSARAQTVTKKQLPLTDQYVIDRVGKLTNLVAFFDVAKIEAISGKSCNIPFLSSQISERSGIDVEFKPGKLKLGDDLKARHDRYTRRFIVKFDSETSQLWSMSSISEEAGPPIIADLPPERAEFHMRNNSESYTGFPKVEPKVTFLAALNTVQKRGLGNPREARKIEGYYVLYSSVSITERPVWVIATNGMEEDRMAKFGFARARDIVDAMTGKWLRGTSVPTTDDR